MLSTSAIAAEEDEIASIQITGAICKILSPDKKTSESCSDLTERALVGELSVDEQESRSKNLLKEKGIKIK